MMASSNVPMTMAPNQPNAPPVSHSITIDDSGYVPTAPPILSSPFGLAQSESAVPAYAPPVQSAGVPYFPPSHQYGAVPSQPSPAQMATAGGTSQPSNIIEYRSHGQPHAQAHVPAQSAATLPPQSQGVPTEKTSSFEPIGPAPYYNTNAMSSSGRIAAIMTSPWAIIRAVEFVFTLLSFALMAGAKRFDQVPTFCFLVALNVIAFTYIIFITLLHCLTSSAASIWNYLPTFELFADTVFSTSAFVVGILAAADCDTSSNGTSLCSFLGDKGLLEAGIIFQWFVWPFFTYSAWESYQRHKQLLLANANPAFTVNDKVSSTPMPSYASNITAAHTG